MPEQIQLRTAGVDAVVAYVGDQVDAGTAARVAAACTAIERELGTAMVDLVPSYASVLVIFDPLEVTLVQVQRRLRRALAAMPEIEAGSGKLVQLPVYYDPEAGADLQGLAQAKGLSIEEVIALHSGTEYRVYAIGFAPGFAYLGEVDERIAAPRLDSPRSHVPRGAVGIAERQTAIYPAPSPGGWNLIGLCPTAMFDPQHEPHMPVAVGDRIRFQPITRARFLELGGTLP